MPLDSRLACLKDAILQDWRGLEAVESGGKLIIGIKADFEYQNFEPATRKKNFPSSLPLPH